MLETTLPTGMKDTEAIGMVGEEEATVTIETVEATAETREEAVQDTEGVEALQQVEVSEALVVTGAAETTTNVLETGRLAEGEECSGAEERGRMATEGLMTPTTWNLRNGRLTELNPKTKRNTNPTAAAVWVKSNW